MAKYDGINFKAPDSVKAQYRIGLDNLDKAGPGLEQSTVRQARDIVAGEAISPEWARKGNRFWGRNERFLDEEKGSPAWVSAKLWGGRPGMGWFNKLYEQMEAADKKASNNLETNVVRKEGSEYCIFSKDGKKLECKPTKAEADKRLAQIEYFKRESNMLRVNVTTKVNAANIRHEKRNGRDVIIVPSATLPDNVVMNRGLYPAEEIEKSYMTLNRKPAPMGHPMVNNMYVSAMEPEAINEYYVGAWNENVRRENGRVYVDKVIDVARAQESEKGRELLEAINKGEPIHTSTGLVLEPEMVENQGDYDWIARNMDFDHDAILLNEPGAATPEQGVGMMVNSAGQEIEVQNVTINMSEMTEEAQESVDYAAYHLMKAIERSDSVSRFDAVKDRIIEAVRGLVSGERKDAMSVNRNEDDEMSQEQIDELKGQVEQLASNQLTKEDLTNIVNEALKPVTDQVEEMKANAAKRDEAEKEALVQAVVNADLLDEETAKGLEVNALQKLAAKAKPAGAHGIYPGFTATNKSDELSDDLPE